MKIFNTKYALTQGIHEQEAEELECSMVKIGKINYLHGEGIEWHRTKESAIKRAEEMRKKKIESLDKQIKKLKSLEFK